MIRDWIIMKQKSNLYMKLLECCNELTISEYRQIFMTMSILDINDDMERG